MFKAAFQGQSEHSRLAELAGLADAIETKLRILGRANVTDKARYRSELRGLLQKHVDLAMRIADELSK